MAAFAGKCQKIFVPEVIASNPGKTAMQVPTIQVFVNYIHNNWAPKPINRCIAFIPNALQLQDLKNLWIAPDQEAARKRVLETVPFVETIVDECLLCRSQKLRD